MDGMNKRTLFLTGAAGFVGGHVLRLALDRWQVLVLARSVAPFAHPCLIWAQGDLLDSGLVARLFAQHRPHAAIHCAAMSDIDACAQFPDQAFNMNVKTTALLTQLCDQIDAKLVFTSTDTVFDGTKSFYREGDQALPVNYYGQTKLEAEQAVLANNHRHAIVRLALVAGLPVFERGNSFMIRTRREWSAGNAMGMPDNEFRTPVFVHVAAQALLELAETSWHGLYHIAGNDRLSRFEMGQKFARKLGVNPDLVQVRNYQDHKARAVRPKDVSMDNAKARAQLRTVFPDFDQALQEMVI